ncbi:unnamed protein product, partial [Nippostrongylus brasiliensis]|uniref:C3H1-type domain-containing protein n=1 Tax=Nippostrongylus brasiliensis TaxID=27835 RepID=A0A0N4XPP0_NIPBR
HTLSILLRYRRTGSPTSSSSTSARSTGWSLFRWDELYTDLSSPKKKDEAFKTALCDAFKKFGFCPYGDGCRFAHGDSELRLPAQAHPKYKTQLCDKFSTYGHCPYGPRCQFIHKLKKVSPAKLRPSEVTDHILPSRDFLSSSTNVS